MGVCLSRRVSRGAACVNLAHTRLRPRCRPLGQRDLDRERSALQTFLEKTVRDVKGHKASWPFLVRGGD